VTVTTAENLVQLRRQLRLVAILQSADETGLTPLPADQLHALAYFADALAPVWGLRIVDSQLLKRHGGPMSPLLQRDLDVLVGRGVVIASDVRHVVDEDGGWRLDALYALNREFSTPITDAVQQFPSEVAQFDYVREVVYAVAGLGLGQIAKAPRSDAAYGDSLIDFGSLLDIDHLADDGNLSVRVARRFRAVAADEVELSSAELVHLYVRELYRRLQDVA